MARGQLPAVSFFKPLGKYNEHPGDAELLAGEDEDGEDSGATGKKPAMAGHAGHRDL